MAVVLNSKVYPNGAPRFVCKGFAQRMQQYEKEDRAKAREEERARNSHVQVPPNTHYPER